MENQRMELKQAKRIRGNVCVPGDKSISHRSIMLGSIAKGTTVVHGFLDAADCRSSMECFRQMGVSIEQNHDEVRIIGRGEDGLLQPARTLDVGNSGTTMRLMSGILAGQEFFSHLDGDESIRKRPMKRIIDPLTQMGAMINSEEGNDCAPLTIRGGFLRGIDYVSAVASAQVKSCVLLAGLYADTPTSVTEPNVSRDHTERMLKAFGASITREGAKVTLTPNLDQPLLATELTVPGDISSAAYFMALAAIHPDAGLCISHVNINETRAGILHVLEAMGAKVKIENRRMESGEEVADCIVSSSALHGTTIAGALIPTLIDELPVIAVMAAFANGETIISDAGELRVKESDRIALLTKNLQAMGVDVIEKEDGMIIRPGKTLHGTKIQTANDHRIAMAFSVAGMLVNDMEIDNPSCVGISYENFYDTLFSVCEM